MGLTGAEKTARYRIRHPERIKAYQEKNQWRANRKYYLKNKTRIQEHHKKYWSINGSKVNEKRRDWRLSFRGKTLYLPWIHNRRTGICEQCGKVQSGKRMHDLHHAKGYVTIFPWYGIVELCSTCHIAVHINGRGK